MSDINAPAEPHSIIYGDPSDPRQHVHTHIIGNGYSHAHEHARPHDHSYSIYDLYPSRRDNDHAGSDDDPRDQTARHGARVDD